MIKSTAIYPKYLHIGKRKKNVHFYFKYQKISRKMFFRIYFLENNFQCTEIIFSKKFVSDLEYTEEKYGNQYIIVYLQDILWNG